MTRAVSGLGLGGRGGVFDAPANVVGTLRVPFFNPTTAHGVCLLHRSSGASQSLRPGHPPTQLQTGVGPEATAGLRLRAARRRASSRSNSTVSSMLTRQDDPRFTTPPW